MGLQPDRRMAGIKGVRMIALETSHMPVENIAIFIPIIAIVMSLGTAMLFIWSDHRRKAQLLEQNHKERMHAIEKGIEMPPLPLGLVGVSNGPATASAPKALRSGIMLTLIGVLLYVAIDVAGGDEGALFGLIPAAIGIANLVYAAVLWHKEKEGAGKA
jgi:uncharacterized protein DUF6249